VALVCGVLPAKPDTIKVGILHSLSGTMAISEPAEGVMLMLIEEQNKKGGLLGRSSRR